MKAFKSRLICLFCLCAAAALSAASVHDTAVLSAGRIFVSRPEKLASASIKLPGLWEFYWNEFIDPALFYSGNASEPSKPSASKPEPYALVKVPSVWNDIIGEREAKWGKGSATYHIRIENLKPNFRYAMYMFDRIGTAGNLYCNGKLAFSQGTPSVNYKETRSRRSMDIAVLESDADGIVDLVFHCSNYVYRIGGLWSSLSFAEEGFIRHRFTINLNYNFFYAGALLSIMLYHLFLFLFRKYDWPSFYFAFFAFTVFLRSVSDDFSLLLLYIPSVPYAVDLKISYTAVFAAPAFFMLHLMSLYNIDLKTGTKKAVAAKIVVIVGAAIGLAMWLSPIAIANYLVIPCLVYLFASIIVILVMIFSELRQSSVEIIVLSMLGVAVISFAAIYDTIITQLSRGTYANVHLLSYAFILFVLFQSLIAAIRHEQAASSIEVLSESLQKTNLSYMRFVPQEFLHLLEKGNITDVEMGNYTTRNVTLLCADIRNFTPISEQLGGKEVFDLLNACFTNIAPLIRTYGGFIEKYLGDCIIAVFPDNTSNIFQCAIEMQQKMQYLKTGKPITLRIGIGIHYGKVILGTTGSAERLSQVAVSEAVDTVMRLESLTKTYGKEILVSGSALNHAGTARSKEGFKFVKIDTKSLKKPLKDELFSLEIPETFDM